MKKERSFQRKLLPIILLLAAVPLFLFSILALVSLRGILVDRYEEQVDSDLAQSEKLLDITLERYETILDEAAEDGGLLPAAEKATQRQELTEEEREKIDSCLEQIVRQSPGAAGGALLLGDGSSFFFDQPDQIPEGTGWMEQSARDWGGQAAGEGTFSYHVLPGGPAAQEDGGYVFGVFRRFPESPESRDAGALALWLDAGLLCDTLAGERGIKSFVSDGEVIIAATEP